MEEKHSAFLKLITRWNRAVRLVGSTAEADLREHLDDSRALLPHLPSGALTLVDVGSGGGFPSVVIAIGRPDIRVVALEPTNKKWAFLSTVRRELSLQNLEPIAEADIDHRNAASFEPYDVATSRATFAVGEWLQRGTELVRPGGLVIAMEGRERHNLPAGCTRHRYDVNEKQRAILTLRRPA